MNRKKIEGIAFPLRYAGMMGDPGKPLRHFVEDAKGARVFVSEPFSVDYSGGDKKFKALVEMLNASSAPEAGKVVPNE